MKINADVTEIGSDEKWQQLQRGYPEGTEDVIRNYNC